MSRAKKATDYKCPACWQPRGAPCRTSDYYIAHTPHMARVLVADRANAACRWVVVMVSRTAAVVRTQVYGRESTAKRKATALRKVGWAVTVIRHRLTDATPGTTR